MTNNKKISAAALFSALVLGASFATSTVFADGQTGPTQANGGSSVETGHAYATFTRNTGSQVRTPSDPGLSYTPTNTPDITNETGSLTLDAIPSSLNFGTNVTTGQAQVVQLLQSEGKDFSNGKDGSTDDVQTLADGSTVKRTDSPNGPKTSDYGTTPNTDEATKADQPTVVANHNTIFTQVTNLTSGDINWTLSATLSKFYKAGSSVGDTNAIQDASIILKNGKNVYDKDDTTWADATSQIDQTLELKADTPSTIIDGSKETGIFQQQWNDGDVTLNAPKGAPVGQYEADIAWTLSAEPVTNLDKE